MEEPFPDTASFFVNPTALQEPEELVVAV